MWDIITNLYSGLGVSVIDIIIILTGLGALILSIVELRIAIMCAILLYMSEFIMFYEMGYSDFYKPLMVMLLAIVMLIISLLVGHSKSTRMYLT